MNFSMINSPYSVQEGGFQKLKNLKVGGAFMDMGLGKTFLAIWLQQHRQTKTDKVIWYTPVSLRHTAMFEIQKHTDTPENKIFVVDANQWPSNIPSDRWWYIVGTETMSVSDKTALFAHEATTPNSSVVVDESVMIKNPYAIRTKRIIQFSKKAKYRLLLSGIPVTKSIVDLYAQMRFLSHSVLGYRSFYSFASKHIVYSEKHKGMVEGVKNLPHIMRRVEPFVWQATKDEWLDLPEKIHNEFVFELSPKQKELYYERKEVCLENFMHDDNPAHILTMFGDLHRISSGYWDGMHIDTERPQLGYEAIRRTSDMGKVIVWFCYHASLQRFKAELRDKEIGCLEVHGRLSHKQKRANLQEWRGQGRVLLATVGTLGRGETLVESHQAVFYETSFNYEQRLNAEDRIHRIGQTKRPLYIDIRGDCGIEERIKASHQNKSGLIDSVRLLLKQWKHLSSEKRRQLLWGLV